MEDLAVMSDPEKKSLFKMLMCWNKPDVDSISAIKFIQNYVLKRFKSKKVQSAILNQIYMSNKV